MISMHKSIIIALVGFTPLMPLSAQADFLDSLFGQSDPPSQASNVEARAPRPHGKHGRMVKQSHRANRKVQASSDKGSSVPSDVLVRQKTTGLLEDASLRQGDAVMTKYGIRVFSGKAGPHHKMEEFMSLRRVHHLKKEARVVLTAIDNAAHRDVGRNRNALDLLTGRSASEAVERRPSFTDPHASVRYVGP